eukprot:2769969-Prorocentrum_lima.AAC.1
MLDAIKKKSLEVELSPKIGTTNLLAGKSKHDEMQKKHRDDMESLQMHIDMQGHDEALLQGQRASLQDRMH